ncbi:peptidyl-tRNA hydrolase [Sulfurovum sp. TSL6]|uniref:aminoacyl-tRNA hydrolase n=1 Tax=Sulfurovum sp. TSL6 TaxID=2826995 RepID=UPI001CC445FB|nr:aminoacyl-tRNA hydrolase [Sulfurovum sp. TSL6]GIU00926.1 peptidyl-tRNA hydrolase [Sulfurovum sp. TSL6]
MILFVGLGNPGSQYENTRHNIGFKVIDKLVNDFNARDISKTSFQGKLYRAANSLFLKPTTFMNLSGKSVQPVKHFFKVELEDIIVIHDDIDLPFGAVRFKRGGGHGGHNGLKSLDTHITKEYLRVRVGVGKPEHKSQVSDYVLHDFSQEENLMLERLISHVAEACKVLSQEELNEVKSKYSLKSIEGLSL